MRLARLRLDSCYNISLFDSNHKSLTESPYQNVHVR